MATPLIAIVTYHRKHAEWRHIRWITALYIAGYEGIASELIYGGVRNFTDADNPVLAASSTIFLIVALLSVIAIAAWFVLVVPNLSSRRGDTLGG